MIDKKNRNELSLPESLRLVARVGTEGSEYGPDEHVAWIAADRLTHYESLLNRWIEFYTDGAHPEDARILYTDTEKALEKQP